jgi:hypothetical protein
VQDVDFDRLEILVRDGRGGKDRMTMLPAAVVGALGLHPQQRQALFEVDKRKGKTEVYLPDAVARKPPPIGLASKFSRPAVIRLIR